MRNTQLVVLSLLFAGAGLGLFAYKHWALGLPILPHEQASVWTIEARVRFAPTGGPVKVLLSLPDAPPGFEIVDESFVSSGYGLTTGKEDGQRMAIWSRRRVRGEQTLYYRAVVSEVGASEKWPMPKFPQPPLFEERIAPAAYALLADVRERSADVTSFASQLLARLNERDPDAFVRALLEQDPDREKLATELLAGARIPARKLLAVRLAPQSRHAELVPWLAVHTGEEWVFLDPQTGAPGLPEDLVVWARATRPLLEVEGGRREELQLAVARNEHGALELAEQRALRGGEPLMELSLFSLPVATQAVYQVLLLIPIGALLVVVMRNIVGLNMFGTFMPILIALAFRETRLIWGVILFTFIVAVGLAVRFYLDRLKLLLVPRLASVLTCVVLILTLLSVISHALGIERGLSVALFPIVILTMVIERMSIVWEERGARESIKQALGSLLVAVLAFLVFQSRTVQHLVFVFPELLLVLLSVTLLLGRYSGYRLSELYRFRAFRSEAQQA